MAEADGLVVEDDAVVVLTEGAEVAEVVEGGDLLWLLFFML